MKLLFPITYSSTPGSDQAATLNVESKRGIIEFKPCLKGLHYFDMSELNDKEEMHVQTVQQNYKGFSKDQVQCATKARKLQAMLGSPAKADFEAMQGLGAGQSRGIQLITVEFLPRRTAKIIGAKLTRVLHLYQRAGFNVQRVLMDKEFDSVADQCPMLPINTTAANEHVPEIDRAYQQNIARGSCMTLWTHETICMGPTGNMQGSYKFYCLSTKKKLTRRQWDELPMPKSIIRKVDQHAKRDKAAAKLVFSDQNNQPYQDMRNEEYGKEPAGLVKPEPSPFPDIPSELPGIELAKHAEHTPTVTIPDKVEMQARLAAENAGLNGETADNAGPHLVEADPEEFNNDGSILEVDAGIPYEPQEIIDVDGGHANLTK
eukprot:CCRYP_015465-RA/>CCRYP_015465-RA protein AED:0.55 eAED:-0.03 QI:0/0/0/0.2/1/1/5/0/374